MLGAAGVAFGYWVLLPRAVHFLTNYDTQHFQLLIRACSYYSFVVTVLVGIVLVFQTPLVVLGLVSLGVLSSRTLRVHRRMGYLITRGDRPRAARPGSRDDVPGAPADVAALRGVDLGRGDLRAPAGKTGSSLGYSGRLMARAAVKAKQQATAKAQASARARARGRRKHSGGGNPNQDLFFTRLRRRQKWVYMALAIIFAATFVGVGVGSGSGAGLDQLYSGIFGGSGDQVSKAKDEIKKNPAKGYLDLATPTRRRASRPRRSARSRATSR